VLAFPSPQRPLPHAAAVLPFVCAWCERVRTIGGHWEALEEHAAVDAVATHGICPECLEGETRAVPRTVRR
jgi:hypothetical protein